MTGAECLEECEATICQACAKQPVGDQNGTFQQILSSSLFEVGSAAAISAYSVWIAYDVQENKKSLLEADLIFQLGECFFFIIFTMEWLIRFLALARKSYLISDRWLVFDTVMVLLMVADTLIMTIVMWLTESANSSLGGASVFRIARMFRIVRLLRLSRILQLVPELMILLKGIAHAARSVFFTAILLILITYVFAILLCQLTDSTAIGEKKFKSVLQSAFTLMVLTIFPDTADLMNDLSNENWTFGMAFLVYIVLASMMFINLLIGIIVDMVNAVASEEQDLVHRALVWSKMQLVLAAPGGVDEDQDGMISKSEFRSMLRNPAALNVLNQVGVDLPALADHADYFFEAESGSKECLKVEEFIELLMQLRVRNPASVKNMADMRLLVHTRLANMENMLSSGCPGPQDQHQFIEHTSSSAVLRRNTLQVQDFWEHHVPSCAKKDLQHRLSRLENAVASMVQKQSRIVERLRALTKDEAQMPKTPTSSAWASRMSSLSASKLHDAHAFLA